MLTQSAANGRFVFDNALEGYTYGVEIWSDLQLLPWWRVSVGANALEKHLELAPNALAFVLHQHAGNDPERQYWLRSSMDLSSNVELDLHLRAVDELPFPEVPNYVALDARVAWRVLRALELSIAGFNLLDDEHPETGAAPGRRQLRRSAHLEAFWRF